MIKPFDRHDLDYSKRFLPQLRHPGRFRRWDFDGGDYKSGHPNRYYGVRSTAFEALYNARGYKEEDMGTYLDAGCGDSADADIALVTGYSKAYGIDLFRPMNHLSDKDFNGWFLKSSFHLRYKFILGDICEEIPLKSGSIDAISSSWVISLMSQADRLLFYKQAHRLLKRDGVLVVSAGALAGGRGHDDFRINKEVGRQPSTLVLEKAASDE